MDGLGDQALLPQGTQVLVPVALRVMVEQSPVLQPGLHVPVWVKDCPEQTVDGLGDQALLPQGTQVLVPVALRLVEQPPALHPGLHVRV